MLDAQPLLDWFKYGGSTRGTAVVSDDATGYTTDMEIAEILGVSRQRVSQWRNGDRIGVFKADEYAVKVLGVHPCEVWGEEWWTANGVPPVGETT
jgi:hypothetical protein